MKILISIFILGYSGLSFAQSDQLKAEPVPAIQTSVPPTDETTGFRERHNIYFMINGYPVPLFSGGMRIDGEYLFHPRFSLAGGLGRTSDGESIVDVNLLGPSSKVVNTDQFVAVRSFFLRPRMGFYFTAGYKWGDALISENPGFMRGDRIERKIAFTGPIGGFGYRFESGHRRSYHWIYDLEVNYEPGSVTNARYVPPTGNSFSASPAFVKADIGYDLMPQMRFGVAF